MCLTQFRPDLFNQQTFDASSQFSDVFEELLSARSYCDAEGCTEEQEQDLSQRLQQLVAKDTQRLFDLPRHKSYSRHVIGVDEDWVAYICRWEKSTVSCVHGHPWFAYYQVLDGVLNMDIFEPVANDESNDSTNNSVGELAAVQHVQSRHMLPGDVAWSVGEKGRYDNLIHSVSTDQQPGFTLHLFSENPALGDNFRVVS